MFRMQYTVIILFIIVKFDLIYCASVFTEKEIENVRDDTVTGNSSLEARSKSELGIDFEKLRTPSGASDSISPHRNIDNATEFCINDDFESYDEDYYSSEEHNIPLDDEGNVIIIPVDIGKRNVEDEADIWTDTGSETKDTNDKYDKNDGDHNKDAKNDRDGNGGNNHDDDNFKFDSENIVNEDDKYHNDEEDIQAYKNPGGSRGRDQHGHRSSRGIGHRGGRRHGGGRHGHRHHRRYSGGHHRVHLSKVFMPTGKMVYITVPEELKRWKCSKPTMLINLDPNDKNGGQEFKLVSNVVQLTKKEHPNRIFDHYDFVKIERVVNGCFWKRYRARQKEIHDEAKFVNERMLFHATNKIKDLLKSGFDERYSNINGMFGAGIYFAKHSSKSNRYAFGLNQPCPVHNDNNCDKCERQMFLCRVALGKMKKETGATKIAHAPPGYNSVAGLPSPGGLLFPEYIVYRGEQAYPEYLITYKIVK